MCAARSGPRNFIELREAGQAIEVVSFDQRRRGCPDTRAQFGGACAWIAFALFDGGPGCALAQRLEARRSLLNLRQVPRNSGRSRAVGKEALHDTILERMEGHDN